MKSNENVKWYFRDTSYNSWPIVWRHPQQLCLCSRRGSASPQSALSSLLMFVTSWCQSDISCIILVVCFICTSFIASVTFCFVLCLDYIIFLMFINITIKEKMSGLIRLIDWSAFTMLKTFSAQTGCMYHAVIVSSMSFAGRGQTDHSTSYTYTTLLKI